MRHAALPVLAAIAMVASACGGGVNVQDPVPAATPDTVATGDRARTSSDTPVEVPITATVLGFAVCDGDDADATVTLLIEGADEGQSLDLVYAAEMPADGVPASATATATVQDTTATFDLQFDGDEEQVDLLEMAVADDGAAIPIDGPRTVSLMAQDPEPC